MLRASGRAAFPNGLNFEPVKRRLNFEPTSGGDRLNFEPMVGGEKGGARLC